MKLSKNFSHGNLDGMFRLILLLYGKVMKKHLSKFYVGQFNKEFYGCKFDKKTDFCSRFWKLNPTENGLELLMLLKRNPLQKCTVMAISCQETVSFIFRKLHISASNIDPFSLTLIVSTIDEKLVELCIFYIFLY